MTYNRTSVFNNLEKDSKNTFLVADEYRTNPLSHIEGGATIEVTYNNGTKRIYDKIKNVAAYIKYINRKEKDAILNVAVL